LSHLGDDTRESISRVARVKLSYEALAPTFLEIYRAGLE